jgi:uncharacterized protein (DUF983 family)
MEISEQRKRTPGPAIWPGMNGRCPNCGKGRLFSRFLKVEDHCAARGAAFHHERANDLPAWVVILIVGYVVEGSIVEVETFSDTPLWLQEILWPSLVVVLSLALIRPIKGPVIALQWSLRRHGFRKSKSRRPSHDEIADCHTQNIIYDAIYITIDTSYFSKLNGEYP